MLARYGSLAFIVSCLVGYAHAADATDGAVGYPPADLLLARVRSALPDMPLKLLAEVQTRQGRKLQRLMRLETRLHGRADHYEASYLLLDAFGGETERLDVRYDPANGTSYQYFSGDPLTEGNMPSLTTPLAGTDITWAELSLSFLWWSGGRTVGEEDVKGRACYIVDLPVPEGEPIAYAGVRVWVDPHINVLLQAEGYDKDGDALRRLEVKSFKKLDDVWFIKNIQVQSLATGEKTVIRVRSVEEDS